MYCQALYGHQRPMQYGSLVEALVQLEHNTQGFPLETGFTDSESRPCDGRGIIKA